MFERARSFHCSAAAMAVVLALAPWTPCTAQTVEQVEQRIRFLRQRLEAVEEEIRNAAATDTTSMDTLRAAPLTGVTEAENSDNVESVLRTAAEWLRDSLGSDAEIFADDWLRIYVDGTPARRELWTATMTRVHLAPGEDPQEGTRKIISAFALHGKWRRAETAEDWFGARLPIFEDQRTYLDTFMEMATTQIPTIRSCLAGNVEMCRITFFPKSGDDVAAMFTGESARWAAPYVRSLARRVNAEYADCTAGVDDACRRLLQSIPVDSLRPLVSTRTRRTLLAAAAEVGGDGAYTRFLGAHGRPIEQRLGEASGVATDSLLARWRNTVAAARPAPTISPPRTTWTVLTFCVMLAMIAMRSSRWR